MIYDAIVVGGGSAGCVVASRLAQADLEVLLLEAGTEDSNPLIHIPAGYSKILQRDTLVWPYETVPQRQLDGRSRAFRGGKVIGGGSSINAMAYVRGQARDYAAWQAAAGAGDAWSYEDMLRHFRAQESNDTFANEYHGSAGPLQVSMPHGINELNLICMRAFQEYGLPYNADYNGETQRGVSPVQVTIGASKRCSSAVAFLTAARARKNLTVLTDCFVTRVLIEKGAARGVEYTQRGKQTTAMAKEVVLSAGAVQSPKILMLSGIGPAAHLGEHGIKIVVDAPDVGQKLQDHSITPLSVHCKGDLGYQKVAQGMGTLKAGLRYYLTKDGPAASNGVESVSYFNPDHTDGDPTIQCYHMPVISEEGLTPTGTKSGLTFELVVLRPKSRGSVRLKDANPASLPLIDPNWLSDPEDMRQAIGSIRYTREVMQTAALREILEPEHSPGAAVQTDAALAEYIKKVATTMWHPVGTCRMGSDHGAVVDAQLRVNGISHLRIIDASIMPNIISGNTNAPTMALANKGVEMMLGTLH